MLSSYVVCLAYMAVASATYVIPHGGHKSGGVYCPGGYCKPKCVGSYCGTHNKCVGGKCGYPIGIHGIGNSMSYKPSYGVGNHGSGGHVYPGYSQLNTGILTSGGHSAGSIGTHGAYTTSNGVYDGIYNTNQYGSYEVNPVGSYSTNLHGSYSTIPNGYHNTNPHGSYSTIPNGYFNTNPHGYFNTNPHGSYSTTQYGAYDKKPVYVALGGGQANIGISSALNARATGYSVPKSHVAY